MPTPSSASSDVLERATEASKNGDVAALVECGDVLASLERFDEAVAHYDKALTISPEHTEAHNRRGDALSALKRFNEALACYDQVLALTPEDATALVKRGATLHKLDRREEAIACCERALEIRPDDAGALNMRAVMLHEFGRRDEALASIDLALKARPDYAEALNNRGILLKELRRFPEALACFERAQELAPDFAEAHWNEALLRLLIGDFAWGWPKYEWRWKRAHSRLPGRDFSRPQWDGLESVYDKTILLYDETEAGDAIQFCRYVPLLAARGARVVLAVAKPLRELMRGVAGVAHIASEGEAMPSLDLHCPLSSLPLAFATKLDTIPSAVPYLRPSANSQLAWETVLAARRRPRIGIVWSHDPGQENDPRSIALDAFLPLLDNGATFFSLQRQLSASDHAILLSRDEINLLDDALTDFTDLAGLISRLDLVIAVDSDIAHLAGALGKPVWILVPFIPDWRWLLDRNNSPWYPTARLFRQTKRDDWSDVMARVVSELPGMVNLYGAAAPPVRNLA